MKLQDLLKQNLQKLVPQAGIIVDHQGQLTAQTVVYQPQILNLGAVLLAYYVKPEKVMALTHLGNCLSVGHYIEAPRALRCGLDFANDPVFRGLSAKTQKHLTGELQDCTISFKRDLHLDQPAKKLHNLKAFLTKQSTLKYVYLYRAHRWQIVKLADHGLDRPVSLRMKITQLLKKA